MALDALLDFLVRGATAVLSKPLVMEDLADILICHNF
jgi:hypothetical protein